MTCRRIPLIVVLGPVLVLEMARIIHLAALALALATTTVTVTVAVAAVAAVTVAVVA